MGKIPDSAPYFPIIGISGGNADSASVRAAMTQIRDAGAIPIFLGNHANRKAAEDVAKLDGLMVMGNNADIDPEKYGAQKGPHTKAESDTPEGKARAAYEYELMRLAIEKKMPVLGVCGGMQRLNVLAGGTLHQHVPDLVGNDMHAQQDANIAPFIPVQLVSIFSGTGLSAIAGDTRDVYTPAHGVRVPENSMHHQSVDKPGKGLRVSALSHDNIIEAIEADPKGPYGEQMLIGVQWHPEFGASPLGKRIADSLVAESTRYGEKNPHTQPNLDEVVRENVKSNLPVMKGINPGVGRDLVSQRQGR
jgi:putative glutamine amidotransferase